MIERQDALRPNNQFGLLHNREMDRKKPDEMVKMRPLSSAHGGHVLNYTNRYHRAEPLLLLSMLQRSKSKASCTAFERDSPFFYINSLVFISNLNNLKSFQFPFILSLDVFTMFIVFVSLININCVYICTVFRPSALCSVLCVER